MKTTINVLLDEITRKDHKIFENVTFTGDLDKKLITWFNSYVRELPKDDKGKYVINCCVEINNCIFKGNLNFSRFHFRQVIIVQSTTFEGDVNFTDARFEGGIFFDGNILRGNALFFLAHFKNYAHFMGTKRPSSNPKLSDEEGQIGL